MLGPPEWRRRFDSLSLKQIAHIVDAPYETVFRWLQLLQARRQFGTKDGKAWTFDVHEFYVFNMVAAFHKAGIPIGPTIIHAVADFTYDGGAPIAPTGRLTMTGHATEFRVDAVQIYEATRFAMFDEVPPCLTD